MITGDKQETAINIAIACRLVVNPGAALILNASSPEAARAVLEDALASCARSAEARRQGLGSAGAKGGTAQVRCCGARVECTPSESTCRGLLCGWRLTDAAAMLLMRESVMGIGRCCVPLLPLVFLLLRVGLAAPLARHHPASSA